ncbi:MAG: TolC family protein [Nitrospirota bacterium]|nr:TolC family protein [Nitrospirota bacterium]
MKKLSYIAMFLMLPVLSLTMSAASAEQTVSLGDAVRLALERSHYLRAAESQVRGLEQDVSIARSQGLPSVMLEESMTRTDIPAYVFSSKINQERMTGMDMTKAPASFNEPNPLTNFRTALSVEQQLFAPRTGVKTDMARTEVEASRLRLRRTREDVVFNVVAAYIEVQKALAAGTAVEAGLREAEEHLRVAKVREDAGIGARADVLRAGVALAGMQSKKVRIGNDLKIARARLALAMGGEAGEEVGVQDDGLALLAPQDAAELVGKAMDARNDLKDIEKRLDNTKNLERLARADYLPTLSLSGSYQLDDRDIPFGSDGQHWMVGATLRWEAFDGFRRRAEMAKAHEARTMLREHLEAYRKEVAFRVNEAWLRMTDADQRMEIADKAMAEAEEGNRLVAKRFENSLTTMADLLDAQASLDEARATRVQAEKDRSLAIATVWYSAGLLMGQLNVAIPESSPGRGAYEK